MNDIEKKYVLFCPLKLLLYSVLVSLVTLPLLEAVNKYTLTDFSFIHSLNSPWHHLNCLFFKKCLLIPDLNFN